MWTPERVYPLGFPGRQALRLTLGGLGVAFAISYFRFLASFSSAKNELYTSVKMGGKWVPKLMEGSVIAPFSHLLGGVSLALALVALCLIVSLFLHYAWHIWGPISSVCPQMCINFMVSIPTTPPPMCCPGGDPPKTQH